jgi:hypothetical protein
LRGAVCRCGLLLSRCLCHLALLLLTTAAEPHACAWAVAASRSGCVSHPHGC